MNQNAKETEFHMTIGITVRGSSEHEPVQGFVAEAVQELAHMRSFLSGGFKDGVIAEHSSDFGRIVTTTSVARARKPAHKSGLPPHQQRVLDEKAELDERRGKLTAFYSTPTFHGLPESEQSRLLSQGAAMRSYSEILGERIANF